MMLMVSQNDTSVSVKHLSPPQVIIHHVARLTQLHIDDIYFLRDDDKEFSIFFKNGKRNEVISTSKSNCYVSDEYFTVYKRCSHYFPDDLIVWDKDSLCRIGYEPFIYGNEYDSY